MNRITKTLGTLLAMSTLAIVGCGKSEITKSKQYLMLRKDLPYCSESSAPNPIEFNVFSPAKDQSPGAMRLYARVSAKEIRELGLNPDNICEFNYREWRKYIGNPIEE